MSEAMYNNEFFIVSEAMHNTDFFITSEAMHDFFTMSEAMYEVLNAASLYYSDLSSSPARHSTSIERVNKKNLQSGYEFSRPKEQNLLIIIVKCVTEHIQKKLTN